MKNHFLRCYSYNCWLTGWDSIGACFRISGEQMKSRFGKELRALGVVFDSTFMKRNFGARNPCALQPRLKLWAFQKTLRGETL
jgi:hypothetical protein